MHGQVDGRLGGWVEGRPTLRWGRAGPEVFPESFPEVSQSFLAVFLHVFHDATSPDQRWW